MDKYNVNYTFLYVFSTDDLSLLLKEEEIKSYHVKYQNYKTASIHRDNIKKLFLKYNLERINLYGIDKNTIKNTIKHRIRDDIITSLFKNE